MLINIDPAILAAPASFEVCGKATMAGATAAAAGPTCAVLPPPPGRWLCARGAATSGILAEYIAMRGLFAGAIGTSGATYEAVEGINLATATIGGA